MIKDLVIGSEKKQLAVFDFDGTIVSKQSGSRLAIYLFHNKKLKAPQMVRLGFWGFRYKMHLPHSETKVREVVFKGFKDMSPQEVHDTIADFYEEELQKVVRKDVVNTLEKLNDDGLETVILSATFYDVIDSFRKQYNVKHIVCTKMEMDNDMYTGFVEGSPVVGKHKISALEDYADKTFGKDNWSIEYAFADHYTDKDLLKLANYPVAVSPDGTLERFAKKNNWEIINFEKRKKHE